MDTTRCPPGLDVGDHIWPPTGYTSNSLTRNTGTAIDPSGNVWLANNWKEIAVRNNPFANANRGDGRGRRAAPTPLIGPPEPFD